MAIRKPLPLPVARVKTTREVWEVGPRNDKFLKVVTMNTAFQVLREDQRKRLFPANDKEFTTWVDRSPRKIEAQVKFGGSIWYIRNQQLSEVYQYIWDEIYRLASNLPRNRKKSGKAPFRRRHYRQSTVVMVDNKTWVNVGEGRPGMNLTNAQRIIKPSSTVKFVNVQPYAKRIEHGSEYKPKLYGASRKNKGKFKRGPRAGQSKGYLKLYWSDKAKRGIFQVVAKEAAKRFRGVAQIDYRRMQIPQIGYQFTHDGTRIDQFYPVIRVRPDRSGVSRVK